MIRVTEKPRKHMDFLPGQLIVRIEEQAVRPHVGGRRLSFHEGEAALLPEAVSAPIDYLLANAGLEDVQPLFSTRAKALARRSMAPKARSKLAVLTSVADSASEELAGLTVATVDRKKVTSSLIKHVNAAPAVQFVERLPARWLAATAADPGRNLQWGLRAIGWFNAGIPSATRVTVAVVDSGIDAQHPDLGNAVSEYHHEGFSAADVIGHGTHVAGTIAARVNNAAGIAGVARCKLAVWKVISDTPAEDDEYYVDTVRYLQALEAVRGAGARVVNLSLGGTERSETEALLIDRLHRAGVLVVAAMGNEYDQGNPTEYPAAFRDVLSVGAVAETRDRSFFSNTGPHIDLVAPGSHVLSTLPRRPSVYGDSTSYGCMDGTSMATPHVSGAAALVAAGHRGMEPEDVKARLKKTATQVPGMRGRRWTQWYGAGLLNVARAVS